MRQLEAARQTNLRLVLVSILRGVHPTAHIAANVQLADDVIVGAHASIDADGEYVRIGKGVVIGPGCRIGQMGFGFIWDDTHWIQKPHRFGVIIEDDVQIGANTCIDRGSWRPTLIEKGTIIDNLVHIAHNVEIRQKCAIVAQAEISGSVTLQEMAYIGPCASIRERLTVGFKAIVGMGAVVTKDVPSLTVVAGVPARALGPVTEWPPPPPAGK